MRNEGQDCEYDKQKIALLAEIQKLSGLKITDANSATVESFEQQYQTLNTATNAHPHLFLSV
jgi:hypothetical protein